MAKTIFIKILAGLLLGLAGAAYAQNAPWQGEEEPGGPATSAISGAPVDYRLNAGDILSIQVWKEPDLQKDVLIRPDGKFSFPLAGDIQASGRTVEEVREKVTERLSRFIPDLVVSISVLQISGNKIYVIGQVSRPGEIIANPQIDVVQAIAIAGGYNPFAQLNDIKIIRRTPTGQIAIPFRYGDIEKGKRLEQNILLKAGDIVIVP
jgi:polysaccharide export outer membrane protein